MAHALTFKMERIGPFSLGLTELNLFARKFIRASGSVTRQDIENESNTISKLCRGRHCKYVVQVEDHGWLDDTETFYFIDMEYCSETLEARIRGSSENTEHKDAKDDIELGPLNEDPQRNTNKEFTSSDLSCLKQESASSKTLLRDLFISMKTT